MTSTEERLLRFYSLALNPDSARGGTDNGGYCPSGDLTLKEWKELFDLANEHHVYSMIFDVASSKGGLSAAGPAALKKWSVRAKSETLGQAQTSAEFLKLYMFLAERGLSPMTVKGIILRDLYPNPEQRISADEDLLISEGDFPKYHDALLDYGMSVVDPDTDTIKEHEISYCNGLLYLELHKKAFPDDSKAYGDLNRFFNDVEKKAVTAMVYGVPIKTMGYSDHLFYLICHAYKHFINCGIGIRYVSDIVLFSMAYLDKIEWALIKDLCEQIKASRFTSALYRIGEKYLFPECFPDVLKSLWDTSNIDETALLDDILKGGIYGTSSESRLHSSNLTLYAAEAAKNDKRKPAYLSILFPSYKYITRKYPWVRKMPFLLPAAWVIRIVSYGINSIFGGKEGNKATEAVRIGSERVSLMRYYQMIDSKKKKPSLLKRIYEWTHTSFLAPILHPIFYFISMTEYFILNLKWHFEGNRMPGQDEIAAMKENVTFIIKSFERQQLVKGLLRNISRMYPGTAVIVADDSRKPLKTSITSVSIIHLPFNSGLGAGLEAALKEVKTPYIVRLDDDELLTVRSKIHRELDYLIGHPDIDMIGFGYTSAVRLHSPEFYFKEYYRTPMNDALRPLTVPHMTKIDDNHIVLGKVANIYLARTEKIRKVGYDPNIRVIDHHEFFWRAAGIITSAAALDTVVFHRHNPYERRYNMYRSDYEKDLDYIKNKRQRMIIEQKKH